MKILAIDTSCDETSVAVTSGRKILSNVMFSQIEIHKEWGGVVPNLAKWAHVERIDGIVQKSLDTAGLTMSEIDAIAVTYGPGLSVALGVGIAKAVELAKKYNKKIIPVNHMEGHIYSCFAQNATDESEMPIDFPYLVLLVSGKHTDLVLLKDHISYEILGKTLDDASGEALDKGARLILNSQIYPGGIIIEKMARSGDPKFINFPRPMIRSKDLLFSFSGLKTALFYQIRKMSDKERKLHENDLAASYQEAIFDSLIVKLKKAVKVTGVKNIVVGGGVAANQLLRSKIQELVDKNDGTVLFPHKGLYGDNAAMIGIAGYYKAKKGMFAKNIDRIDRVPRASLDKLEKF